MPGESISQRDKLRAAQARLPHFGMAEVLPAIDIAISVEPLLFLERMADLAEPAGMFRVERHSTSVGDRRMDVVNFRLQAASVHDDHGFQLITHDDRPGRVQVEMRASLWSPDPPTAAVYSEAAQTLAGDLLKQYNRDFGTRHRLRIGTPQGKGFAMSERTATMLERFTILANTSSLHFYDWQRFYALVREARQEIPGHVFRARLIEAGFSGQRSAELAEIYAHLWAFKRLR